MAYSLRLECADVGGQRLDLAVAEPGERRHQLLAQPGPGGSGNAGVVMRALDRKLLRDLGRMKAQALAIALVVASGVTLFLMMFTAYDAIRASEDHFYTEQRFAHVWSSLARAPRSVASSVCCDHEHVTR